MAEAVADTVDGLKALLLSQESNIASMQDENVRLTQMLREALMGEDEPEEGLAHDISAVRMMVLEFVNRMATVTNSPRVAVEPCMGGAEQALNDIKKYMQYGTGLMVKYAIGAK